MHLFLISAYHKNTTLTSNERVMMLHGRFYAFSKRKSAVTGADSAVIVASLH